MTEAGKTIASGADPREPGGTPETSGVDLQRVTRLVADLEEELAKAPRNAPDLQDLRDEIATLKQVLGAAKIPHHSVRERLHAVRLSLDKAAGSVQYEILKDAPYVAEIGRILGL